jgi:hypothetical protein
MAVTAGKRIIYAGDDLILNLVWKNGDRKTPGDAIDLNGSSFVATLVKSGSIVATGVVTTVAAEGKIKVAFSEAQTTPLSGSYEMRLRHTDSVGDTSMFLVMPVEVRV